ncbi:MAG TPA: DUF2892 domain-containing protein [Myxococcales bacterium]|jgi:hypothetical protein|nr:DUF2892 domain-containing protein [Myxococcales bacterium]
MTVQRFVLAFAGSMVLASVLLAHFVHPGFLWVTAFVGANLLQSAFTGFCPLAMIVRRAGLPDRSSPLWAR